MPDGGIGAHTGRILAPSRPSRSPSVAPHNHTTGRPPAAVPPVAALTLAKPSNPALGLLTPFTTFEQPLKKAGPLAVIRVTSGLCRRPRRGAYAPLGLGATPSWLRAAGHDHLGQPGSTRRQVRPGAVQAQHGDRGRRELRTRLLQGVAVRLTGEHQDQVLHAGVVPDQHERPYTGRDVPYDTEQPPALAR